MCRSNPFRISIILTAILLAGRAQAQGPYPSAPVNRYVGETVPDIWDESQPLERFFAAVAKRSRVTLEYLHWDLENPDDRTLGAPITDVPDPSIPFQVFNNNAGSANVGLGVVVNSRQLGLEDSPGARGTLAVDLSRGTLETSFFGLSQNNHDFMLNNLQAGRIAGTEGLGTALRPNVITPLLTNGVATAAGALNAAIYDESYRASIETQLWGAEMLFLREYYLPNEPFNWQWLGGFRYISIEEDVTQVGVFNSGGALTGANVVTTTIGGDTYNNIYGPQFGGRASLRSKFVSLSLTPRIGFALNDHTSSVIGNVVGGTSAGTVLVKEESIDFTTVFELNLKLQFHLTPNLTVFGGYDLFFAGNVSRPTDNIIYDSTNNGAGFDPTLRQSVTLDDFTAHGLNLGAILTY